MLRNTEAWVEQMRPRLEKDEDGSLAVIGVSGEQAVADVDELLRLVRKREPGPEVEGRLVLCQV